MKKISEFIFLFIIWLALTWSLNIQDITAGLIVALITTILFSDLFPHEITILLKPIRSFWFLVYLPVFFWYIIKSNIDVAYRVFHPEMPIRPGIVKVKTSLKSEIGKTFLANSITLTPGTLTVDCIEDTMYIHWINITSLDPEEETKLIVKKFEKHLKRVFE